MVEDENERGRVLQVAERIAPLAGGVIAFAITIILAPDRASDAFWRQAAITIPILLIPLALSQGVLRFRIFGTRSVSKMRTVAHAVYVVFTMTVLIVAELQAFDTLATGKYQTADASFPFAAIAMVLVVCALLALTSAPERTGLD